MSQLFYRLPPEKIPAVPKEAARYCGYKTTLLESDPLALKINAACAQMQKILMPQLVYEEFPLTIISPEAAAFPESQSSSKNINSPETDFSAQTNSSDKSLSTIQFADVSIKSRDLGRNLKGCSHLLLFAATIGPQADKMIRRSQITGSADSAIMQACGAMFIESFVDQFNDEIKKQALSRGFKAHPRYSPGYGDVPIEFQKEIFRLLPCSKIGLTLMESLIMAPEKSVTAFIGLEPV